MACGTNFGESLAELLGIKKLSVEAFTKAVSISVSTYYGWRRGEHEVKLSTLNRIANYFHCSIEYLIYRSDNDWFIDDIKLPNFGQRLRQVMKECGITTYYLRKHHSYNSRHFRSWDEGGDPYLCTLVDLASIFNCTIDHLVGRVWLKNSLT